MNSKSNLITPSIERNRITIARDDLLSNQSKYCQYFTPSKIAKFMASLFDDFPQEIKLLDPGFGIGSLSAAFIEEIIRRNSINIFHSHVESLELVAFEVDEHLRSNINKSLNLFGNLCRSNNLSINTQVNYSDFINYYAPKLVDDLFKISGGFSHVIMNPPYGKIRSDSKYRKLLDAAKINASNLYSGFVSLSIELLKDDGEIVAIIPRSFCNGPYFESFRKFLLKRISLKHIHLFVNRDDIFNENEILQETIIIHGKKTSNKNEKITISSSKNGDFDFSSNLPPTHNPDNKTFGHIESESLTLRNVNYGSVIRNNDPQKLIYIAPTEYDQLIENRLKNFSTKYEELDISISTGPVVDFRSREYLLNHYKYNSAPLIYPNNAKLKLIWPIESNKPSAIKIDSETKNKIWENRGFYIIVNRFSSKEEKRRIKATLIDTSLLPGNYIAFDNKLNVYHRNKRGIEQDLAKGLFIYLNSSLLDKYYRQFGGHTQVNANDLKSICYPSLETLLRIGKNVHDSDIEQNEIDKILDLELEKMALEDSINPLEIEEKINEALVFLT
jgi:adenine-specific DNA-methyltransferase